ncbi:NADH-quinone oxidoreductase subunit J family protein [Candidatus Magnetomonas plexicatena]|uniref:NADH-quinone oxidoreductase subunit J family protein n=1 Tax=Candidatus Magnetomonas plexicatena TaxID=2552947 RepID=UPI0011044A0B|nr:NADH-quinone oxidoreductase subunit J [Nitrospirales bacterium LBB_01]
MLSKVFFIYFATVIVLMSSLAITRRNAMHGVLYMLLMFFHLAGLYLFLNAEFLAAVQIIIYAGAIMVLFLFVVMLLNLREDVQKSRFIRPWVIGFIISSGVMVIALKAAKSAAVERTGHWGIKEIQSTTHISAIGQELYTRYLYPFELASLVLLVAIVGAIVLAKKRLK